MPILYIKNINMRKDFCLCFNDGYVSYACVTIKSIIDNMDMEDELHIYVLSDYLSDTNRTCLENYGVEIHIVQANETFVGIDTHEWPIYTLYRLFVPNILGAEVKKVLYLDCDVIVNGNLNELFGIDMTDKAIAGCLDTNTYSDEVFQRLGYNPAKRYICAGVLLMNLDYWRGKGLSYRVIDYMKNNPEKIAYLEQDALNFICQDSKIILPARYGVLVPFFFFKPFLREHLNEMNTLIDAPVIIHYAGYFPWVYCKDKSLHSYLWWNICKRLDTYSKVRRNYYVSMVKWFVRYILSTLHLIDRRSRYNINQYYNHHRVKKEDVLKTICNLRGIEIS